MITPIYAGFEGAKLHWNGLDVLAQTGHADPDQAGRNAAAALMQGARGIRDTLPERLCPSRRYAAIRRSVHPKVPIIWSAVHFDQPLAPLIHARLVANRLGHNDRLIAVNEPSVGYDVSGHTRAEALALAAGIMATVREVNPDVRFWTADPVHRNTDDEWGVTDVLVKLFGVRIDVVGINYHAHSGEVPLRYILQEAARRYPRQRIGITETSWHDGHEIAEQRFPGITGRRDWLRHVQHEIAASEVKLACLCWAPWLDMAWEPGQSWPNGWPNKGTNV